MITIHSAESAASAADAPQPQFSQDCKECHTFMNNSLDPKNDLCCPVHGWPELARVMAAHPDFATFQRFRDLNVKSLLYYQAELADLRRELHKIEWEDHRDGGFEDASRLSSRIDVLWRSGEAANPERTRKQWLLVQRIRGILKDYSKLVSCVTHHIYLTASTDEALLQFSQISALPDPETVNRKALKQWIMNPGKNQILGPGADSWGNLATKEDDHKDVSIAWEILGLIGGLILPQKDSNDRTLDLVATGPSPKIDPFTNWLMSRYIPFIQKIQQGSSRRRRRQIRHRNDIEAQAQNSIETQSQRPTLVPDLTAQNSIKTQSQGPTLVTYSYSMFGTFTSSVSTMFTCLLPTIAITILAQLHRLRDLLLCLAGFTALFALAVPYLTRGSATKMEIFVASAA
jgi:hypothetical protein